MTQTDTEWRRIWRLFHAAREQGPAERAALLAAECAGDDRLRAEVETLLRAHDDAEGFLEPPPAAARDAAAHDEPDEPGALVGRRIGGYLLRRRIAEGGMGVVYEAAQENPHRTVALKLLRPAAVSAAALRRFEYEAEILARLVHPGIAQVYAAGTHDDGTGRTPFFAMEYVPGAASITAFAAERRLDLRARVALFCRVCEAVHHGHQRGVIHRDLKPANILVDDGGNPKVIDFGVARATDSDLAVTTMRTGAGEILGTLPYMSPEQCAADPREIDVRSDVYALGVVLYELLCGRLPCDLRGKPIPEAIRIVREHAPVRPSAVDRALRGDLETIVLKALEKDPARRYQSAADLLDDLRHYLNREPIGARPPSFLYHLRMHARRNRVAFAAAAVIAMVLVAAAVVSTGFAVQTEGARRRVQLEADRVRATNRFLNDLLLINTEGAPGRADMTIADLLDRAGRALDADAASRADVRASNHLVLAQAQQSIGRYVEAERHYRAALRLTEEFRGASDPDTLYYTHRLLDLLIHVGRFEEAQRLARPALAASRRARGDDDPVTLGLLTELGWAVESLGDPGEAEALFREAWRGYGATDGPEHPLTLRAMKSVADALLDQGRLDEAEAAYRETLAIAEPALGEEHPWVMAWIASLGEAQRRRGDLKAAERNVRRALALRRRIIGPEHAETLLNMHRLAEVLRDEGRLAEAEGLWKDAIAAGERTLSGDNYYLAMFRQSYGAMLVAAGRYAEAEPQLAEAHERLEALLGPDHPRTRAAAARLAELRDARPPAEGTGGEPGHE